MRCAADQFHVDAQFFRHCAQHFIQAWVAQTLNDFRGAFFGARVKKSDAIGIEVVDAPKALTHAYRPSHGRAFHAQCGFYLVQQLYGFTAFAVQFVNERDDGGVAHAAHIKQLDGLRFHAIHRINYHDRGIDRG